MKLEPLILRRQILCFSRNTGTIIALLAVALFLGATEVSNGAAPSAAGIYVFAHDNVLGTSLDLKVVGLGSNVSAKAEAAALAEVDRLSSILSTYDQDSEASQWLKTFGTPIRVSPELFEILRSFDVWRSRTDGALDASAEVVCRLWKEASLHQRLPTPAERAEAVKKVRQRHWTLNEAGHTATHVTDVPLAFNSFTKSFIAACAANAALGTPGVTGVVLNIGGDIVVRGDVTEAIDVVNPRSDAENSEPVSRLRVRNRTVATSGNYRRGVEIAGNWYSHIVDPRSGKPVDHVISATVVAEDATDAGALATAFCVLTPEQSLRLAASIRGVECLLIMKNGERFTSKGWPEIEMPKVQVAAVGDLAGLLATATPPSTDGNMELTVAFELNHFEGKRAKRPYVAVWIEDKDKFPVRTIALWFAKPKWLPDLRSWSQSDRVRSQAEGNDITHSVSSATRSPGKYTVKWDGNDNRGKPVKPGKYTIFIEVAREHGTHQLMKKEMEINGKPQQFQLEPNVEIASASLDYHRADAH